MENPRSKKIMGRDDRRFDEAGFFGGGETAHRLGCTCSTLVILLVLILAGLIVAVVLASRVPENIPEEPNASTSAVTSSTDAQISTALENDGEAIIIISQDEINTGLASSDAYVTIEPDSMYLVGNFMGFDTIAELEPVISGGQLAFDTKNVKVGNLPVPQAIASQIMAQFNSRLAEANKELAVINFTSVEKNQGSLMLKGKVVGR